MNPKKIIKSREKYNIELLYILAKLILKFPEQRMGQILYNFGFITKNGVCGLEIFDPFNEEPYITYKRVVSVLMKCDLYNEIVEQ